MRRISIGIFILAIVSLAWPAFADDLADEADLQFELGTSSYRRGDYRTALEHFLASNRLVPNANVVYNIARSYERLGQYPEAYRAFDSALTSETDAKSRITIQQELDRIRPQVALLEIITDPPGATIYLDRKDLGPRGGSPRVLAVSPGNYRVIVELQGYHQLVKESHVASKGHTSTVTLKLSPLRGRVHLAGDSNISVHVKLLDSEIACKLPCDLSLPVGDQRLRFSRQGYAQKEIVVAVDAGRVRELSPLLDPLVGSLIVRTDEPGARVEVDDKTVGFSPSLTSVNAGKHQVVIWLKGYQKEKREITIEPDRETRIELELTRDESVIAASRRSQSVDDAPSSVSLISRNEITGLAYPTLAEALKGRPGVYFSDDRAYVGIGIRGLGRLGSYGNRVLVLQDGMATNDNWIGSAYVGYDAMTDLGDVERVELVRGPGSVVYGTSAFSGVVNVVTRGVTRDSVETAVDTSYANVARARTRADLVLGRSATLWTSVSAATSQGFDYFIPEYANVTPPQGSPGVARGVDGFQAATMRGRLEWKWFTASWFLHNHDKQYPGAQFETIFGDPRSEQRDTRGFIELKAEPTISPSLTFLSRAYLNRYTFSGQYPHEASKGGFEVDTFHGHWAGVEERFSYHLTPRTTLAVGGEVQWHFDVSQATHTNEGYVLYDVGGGSKPFTVAASYISLDGEITPRTHVSLGTRLDHYSTFGNSANPRLAIMVKPWNSGNFKFIAGRAFRAPSVYELYYNDGGETQVANPLLKPEVIYSAEVEYSHRITPTVVATLSGWENTVHGLIDAQTTALPGYPAQFVNTAFPIVVIGSDASIRRDWRQGWMVEANYGLEHAAFLKSQSVSDLVTLAQTTERQHVSNVPAQNIAVRAFAPILERRLLLGTRWTFIDRRWTRYDPNSGVEQRLTNAAILWDITISGTEDRSGIGYYAGVYNLFDWHYALPVGFEFKQTTMAQLGRSVVAGLSWHY
jgi:outer membrane cobalamin receptor